MSTIDATPEPVSEGLADAINAVATAEQKQDSARVIAALDSPLDQSLKRRPDARQRHSPPGLRDKEPMMFPSPSLDPGVIAAIEGYAEDTRGYVAGAETAMSGLHLGIKAIIDAREASARNPAWTEANQVIAVAEFAGKVQDKATRAVDSALRSLSASIKEVEGTLRAPVTASANTALSAEISAFVRGLDDGKRLSFLISAMRDGDTVTMSAVLSRPAYLSGITKEFQGTLTESFQRSKNPEAAKKLGMLQAAEEKLAAAGGLFLLQVERAMGTNWTVAQRLRTAKTEAEKAFVLSGA